MMRKLIFGCGYLGRRVAVAWTAAGDEVHVVTRSAIRSAEFEANGWVPHLADICDSATLAELPSVDTVLFAVGYDRHSQHSRQEVMVHGVARVVQHYDDRCERFVYISSTSVYGQQHGEWVNEDSPCEPTQAGGISCLDAERIVRAEMADKFNVLRLAGIYGPNRLLTRIESLQRGEPIAGRPDAWLNLIHVDDAVTALLAAEQRWSPGETYLVCDDLPISRGEYFAELARRVNAPPPRFDQSQPATRGAGGLNKRCSNRKLHERLGVALRYPTFKDGLDVPT